MWTSKNLGLEVMEIKVIFFLLTILSFDEVTERLVHSPKRAEMAGLCVKCNEGKTLCDR